MGAHRIRRIEADAAERLLAGGVGGPLHLAELLGRAAAAARASELAGEEAAVTAFRSGRQVPVGVGRRRSTPRPAWATLFGVKVAALVSAVAVAGLAFAAATGVLPNPLRDLNAASPVSTSPAGAPIRTSTGGASPSAASASPRAMPSPALFGLCEAYVAQVAVVPGKALDSLVFTSLIDAAGGKAGVPAYCERLLSSESPGSSAQPDKSGHPTGPPTPHPTGPTDGQEVQDQIPE